MAGVPGVGALGRWDGEHRASPAPGGPQEEEVSAADGQEVCAALVSTAAHQQKL